MMEFYGIVLIFSLMIIAILAVVVIDEVRQAQLPKNRAKFNSSPICCNYNCHQGKRCILISTKIK
ncbi:hypothetical protein ACXX82_00350 [Glaciimonas sp. GNP009]